MKITNLFASVFQELRSSLSHNPGEIKTSLGKNFEEDETCCLFTAENIASFVALMEDSTIVQFLTFDRCYKIADKYLLSMVFAYFVRAKLPTSQYTRINFFAALYLAHDMEEDDEDLKTHLVRWGLGQTRRNNVDYFLQHRDNLWKAMGYRAVVSLQCCHEVMSAVPASNLWSRERSPAHEGATREYVPQEKCSRCKIPPIDLYCTDDEIICGDDSSDDDDFLMEPPVKRLKIFEE